MSGGPGPWKASGRPGWRRPRAQGSAGAALAGAPRRRPAGGAGGGALLLRGAAADARRGEGPLPRGCSGREGPGRAGVRGEAAEAL